MQLHVKSLSLAADNREILKDVSLLLTEKEWMAVLGPNGAGKTSLLRTITGMISATKGSIEVNTREIADYTTRELAKIIGYVPQRIGDVPAFTVEDFLELSVISGQSKYEPIVRTLVDSIETRQLPSLSGGELQRVMIAGALHQSASVLLLDEPTNNLDPKGVQVVEKAISFLQSATSVSALVVTHDINFALRISEKITLMKDGRVVWSGRKNDSSFLAALSEVYEVSFTSVKGEDGNSFIVAQEARP